MKRLFVIVAALAACASDGLISPRRALELKEQGALFVDVRGAEEHRAGHIEGSLLIPADELAARSRELPADRPLVLHCGSGRRSAAAAGLLRGAGFRNVLELEGGLKAWTAEGLPLAKGD